MIKIVGHDLLRVLEGKDASERLLEASVRILGLSQVVGEKHHNDADALLRELIRKRDAEMAAIKIRNLTTKSALEKSRKTVEDETGYPCKRCWGRICSKVFREYGRNCKVCGTKDNLSVHHIKPRDEFGTTDLPNLVPLCTACHDYVECCDEKPRSLDAVIRCGLRRLQA